MASKTPTTSAKTLLRNVVVPQLSRSTSGFPYFSRSAVRAQLKQHRAAAAPQTLNRYLHELTKEGVIFDAGRGWYSALREPFVLDREPVRELVELLEKRFPLLDFSCWSTAQIAAYGHHQLARFVQFVHVERDAMESGADALRQAGQTAYINPSQLEIGKNVHLSDGVIIIRPAIKRAPVDGHYALIEKLLVDLYVEAEALRLMDVDEYRKTLLSAVSAGRVSISVLSTYAGNRRGVTPDKLFGVPIN